MNDVVHRNAPTLITFAHGIDAITIRSKSASRVSSLRGLECGFLLNPDQAAACPKLIKLKTMTSVQALQRLPANTMTRLHVTQRHFTWGNWAAGCQSLIATTSPIQRMNRLHCLHTSGIRLDDRTCNAFHVSRTVPLVTASPPVGRELLLLCFEPLCLSSSPPHSLTIELTSRRLRSSLAYAAGHHPVSRPAVHSSSRSPTHVPLLLVSFDTRIWFTMTRQKRMRQDILREITVSSNRFANSNRISLELQAENKENVLSG